MAEERAKLLEEYQVKYVQHAKEEENLRKSNKCPNQRAF